MKYFYLITLLIFSSTVGWTQEEFTTEIWKKTIENDAVTEVKAIAELRLGHLAILSTDDKMNSLVTIMRRSGSVINKVLFDKKKGRILKSAIPINDDKILLVGETYEEYGDAKGKNGWIVLMSRTGEVLWQKIYGGKKDDELVNAITMEDGYSLLLGMTKSNKDKRGNTWVLRIDEKGNIDWEKDFPRSGQDIVNTATFSDGLYILGGQIKRRGGSEKAFVFAIDKEGNEKWDHKFDTESNLLKAITTFDGNTVLVGYQFGEGLASERDPWAVKINPKDGNIFWDEVYTQGVKDDYAHSVIELLNGRLMLVGSSFSHKVGDGRSKIFYLKINEDDGTTRDDLQFIKGKQQSRGNVAFYAQNKDLILAGSNDDVPFLNRYKTKVTIKPSITWENVPKEKYKKIELEDKGTFAELRATIVSPILLNQSDFKFYLNKDIRNEKMYFENFELSKPAITASTRQFLYTVKSKIPVETKDTMIEMRLYNNLFSVRSEPYLIKIVKDFRLEMVWVSPYEANTSKLPRTVKNNNVTVKLMVFSSEPLDKENFHVIINGRKTEGAKYGETFIKPFLKKKQKAAATNRYNYINNVFLQKGKNEIKLQIEVNGEIKESNPIYRNYYGKDGDFNEIKVDTTYNKELTNLHVLAIGVEHSDLKYTSKDAKDIAAAFKSLEDKKVFKQVNIEEITGKDATKTNIDIAFERYKNAYRIGEITRNDLFVVFISSHGFIYKDSIAGSDDWISFEKFMIQASNYDNAAKQATSIVYENIVANLAAVRCKKVVLIDACFSGGVAIKNNNTNRSFDEASNESINNLITQLSYQQPGLVTITSSTSNQPSYEDKKWENGAFTEAILASFEQGDINNDNIITLSEMYSFINKQIPNLVKTVKRQSQKPTITNFSLGNIPIFQN